MFVRRGIRRYDIEFLAQKFSLYVGPFEDRRTSANFTVLLLHLRSSSLGDPGSELTVKSQEGMIKMRNKDQRSFYAMKYSPLNGQLYHISIGHNPQQIFMYLIRGLRSSHIQHQYTSLRSHAQTLSRLSLSRNRHQTDRRDRRLGALLSCEVK